MDNALLKDFAPQTVDKVERLIDLLDEFVEHHGLKNKLALYGGTAINLFMLNIPRLSVDIDVSFVGATSREAMLAERPVIERSIAEVAFAQGYDVSGREGGHAGRSFVLGYKSAWGPDHVKVDCNYMYRSPLFPIEERETPLRRGARIPTFSNAELVGGKVKAFFDRVTMRDLYDIANLLRVLDNMKPEELEYYRKTMIFYASLSASFPHGFEQRPDRFLGRRREFEEQLLPMLSSNQMPPSLEALVEEAKRLVRVYITPHEQWGA